ncbi:MAG TPA: amidohydrolase family protein, partial [Nannocystaceae bacterium]|nr:amidohydrolase family protein [Nannocystaceae bacterium]
MKRLAAWLGAALIALSLADANGAPAPARAPRARAKATKLAFDGDGPPTFLVGATLRTGDGRRIENSVIEVRGTRIAAVGGAEARAKIPAGAKVIELAGKTVTPGLVAADTSLGLVEIDAETSTRDDAPQLPATVRAAYDAASAIHADSVLVPVNAMEGITSAASTPQGGLVSGQIAWIDLVAGDHDGIVSARAVAMRAHLGQSVEGSRASALLRLRELFDDARFYRTRKGAFDRNQSRELAAHRLDLDALAPVLDGRMPLVVSADRVSDLRALVELQKTGVRVVAVGGAQAWKIGDELARAKLPVIVQPSQNLPGSVEDIGARLENAALLAAAGVEVGIAVLGDAHNARNVTQEAGMAISYGLDPEVALSAITLVIAKAYGMDAHYGSVAPGKVANLVVWGGDPFELSQRPQAVWIRGQPIAMRSRQT